MNIKHMYFIIAFGLSIGCSNNDDVITEEFIIYNNDGIKITLLDVRDSRCPTDLFCIWQGNAEVEMRITNQVDSENFTLNTAGFINESLNFPKKTTIFGLEIELLNLLPYPESDQIYDLEDYLINISVN